MTGNAVGQTFNQTFQVRVSQCRQSAVGFLSCVLMAVTAPGADAQSHGSAYRPAGRCGHFARAPLDTPAWACVGIVAGPSHGLVMPRGIVQVSPRRFILTDMGSWSPGQGRILQLDVGTNGAAKVTVLYAKLDLAHGLAIGPDAKVYVGERGAIWRFDPSIERAPREKVIDGLPATGLHRLKHIGFDGNGNLLINIGAPTDRCEGKSRTVRWPCPDEASKRPLAALWRLRKSDGPPAARLQPLATGLRNSAALAVHSGSGLVLQGENSADYPGGDFPPDELNIIEKGKHYGWPYCAGKATVVPEYRRHVADCRRFASPAAVLPAHSSPLGMLYYSGTLLPELRGKLIVSLHGYRSSGHRIVAAAVDDAGRPLADRNGRADLTDVVAGWTAKPNRRPLGSPVGLAQADDGSLWFVEDKNRTVMVLLRSGPDDGATPPPQADPAEPPSATHSAPTGWSDLYAKVIRPNCGQCHDDFRDADASMAWTTSITSGVIEPVKPAASKMFQAMLGTGGVRPMPPPPAQLDRQSKQQLTSFLASLKEGATGK